jgi:hypothetical protein
LIVSDGFSAANRSRRPPDASRFTWRRPFIWRCRRRYADRPCSPRPARREQLSPARSSFAKDRG